MNGQEQGTQGTEQATATPATAAATSDAGGDLEKVRGLVLQAHPDVVPDLVRGASIDELIASVEPARAAYQAVAERVRAGAPAQAAAGGEASGANGAAAAVESGSGGANPPSVPAGGAGNVIDPANIPASEKIRRGLDAQRRR